jgi:hypothetical protein
VWQLRRSGRRRLRDTAVIGRPIRLKCNPVVAAALVYQAAMSRGFIVLDETPDGIHEKRQLVHRPGSVREICEVVSFEDGRSGTQVHALVRWKTTRRLDAICDLQVEVERLAQVANLLWREIGFRP